VIATGAAVVGGEELGQLSCLFVGPGDAPPALRAASDGADVIILQFPVHQSTPAPAEPI
jgi:hypothetical protein